MKNPYISTVVHCAGPNCDQVKKFTNHWFMCRMIVGSDRAGGVDGRFLIETWNDNTLSQEDNILPLCSESCASKMLARFLSDVKAFEEKLKCASDMTAESPTPLS